MTGMLPGMLGPALALTLNACIWGVSWWPFRQLQQAGLHALWATVLIYAMAVLAITLWRPTAWGQLWRTKSLWILVLASGLTNACFNWGVTVGDVVRVVLLFYLMPLWAVLLARWVLHEPFTRAAVGRVMLALAGAGMVLWPQGSASAVSLLAPTSLSDGLGLLGGFTFALNNVMLRREARQPAAPRALAMFVGGTCVAGALALALHLAGNTSVPLPPAPAPGWLLGALALGGFFLLGNLALQYGAARLPANVTAVVMVSEVLFASASAVLLGASQLTLPLLLGGTLIVAATLWSARV
jgi:drug/metabolite transporter (DMT)-like permease